MNKERILVFIPVYNCEAQIKRVLSKFDESMQDVFTEILIIDNLSSDNTLHNCQETMSNLQGFKVTLIQNQHNVNLGGSHKVAFNYAIKNHYDYLIVLHGDDQGDIKDILPYINQGKHKDLDCLLGARFMPGSKLINYSKFRTFGNLAFNYLLSLISFKKLYDLGSGLNMYKVDFLRNKFYYYFPNALTFNYLMILYTLSVKANFEFFPLTWREEDQVSNVKLWKQSKQLFKILWNFCFFRNNLLTHKYTEQEEYNYLPIYSIESQGKTE